MRLPRSSSTPPSSGRRVGVASFIFVSGLLIVVISLLAPGATAATTTARRSKAQKTSQPFQNLANLVNDNSGIMKSAAEDLLSKASSKLGGGGGGANQQSKGWVRDPQLDHIRNVISGGMTAPQMMQWALDTDGYKELLKHPEIQHRILEALPLLGAIPELKAAQGRRLSDEDTTANFEVGMKKLVNMIPDILKTTADPDASADIVMDMADDPDPIVQEALARMQDGDPDAVKDVKKLFAERAYPGLDIGVLDEMGEFSNREKLMAPLLNNPDVMRFIDQDPHLSNAIRNPIDFVGQAREEYKASKERKKQ